MTDARQRMWRALVVVAGLAGAGLAVARPAAAQLVYDGGEPSDVQATFLGDGYALLQGFTLGQEATFDALRFWGSTWNVGDAAYTGAVRYSVHRRTGTTVGPLLFSASAVGVTTLRAANWFGDFDAYQYDVALGSRTLAAGDYWFGIAAPSSAGLYWMLTADRPEPTAGLYDDGSSVGVADDLAFQLRATPTTVPEPASMTLVATGVLAVGAWARRRRSAAG